MGFPLPWIPALIAVAASVSLNLGTGWLYRRRDRIGGEIAALHLGFDLLQLVALLHLTGGISNPFALLLLVPVTMSATLLTAAATVFLALMASLLLVFLWKYALPLPWLGPAPSFPDPYPLAIVIAITLGVCFLSFYAWQMSAETRRRQTALIATQAALERESRMNALGSLAAAAAHELGGPLGTITLIAHDLGAALGDDPDLRGDIELLAQEVQRCRHILAHMARRAEAEEPFPLLPLTVILREALDNFDTHDLRLELNSPWQPGEGPLVRRSAELLHGLANFIGNAIRHAHFYVTIEVGAKDHHLWIRIEDDGDGFPAGLLPNLGEPFLGPKYSASGSTGLGIFIATTLLERTGGRISFENKPDEGGARVTIRWLRDQIEELPANAEKGRGKGQQQGLTR